MNEKISKLILPEQDGISNLEIRRVLAELETKAEIEMNGYMPADLVSPCCDALKAAITAVERGEVSSICVVAIMPKSSHMQEGSCFITAADDELVKMDRLFHISMAQQQERIPPDDEAG